MIVTQEIETKLTSAALDRMLLNRTVKTRAGQYVRTGWWWIEDVVKTHQFGRLVIRCAHCHLVQWGESGITMSEKRFCVRCGASAASDEPESLTQAHEAVLTLPNANADVFWRRDDVLQFSSESFSCAVAISFKLVRRILKLSQRQLAALSGHPRTYISKIETGAALPTPQTLTRFMPAFRMSESAFIAIVEGLYAALRDSQKGKQ